MGKKAALHCYEIISRTDGKEALILRTCDLARVKREYSGHRVQQVYTRILVDGRELTIAEADRLCQNTGAKAIPWMDGHDGRSKWD